MPLQLPKSRREIAAIHSKRKVVALEQAKRAPFFRGKLDHINAAKLDDPEEWRKIPILDKDMLRSLSDAEFYANFCVKPGDGIAEYWRSGGSTGKPLFYPRSHADIRYGLLSFRRTLDIAGCLPGDSAHVSFPLGIHPVGQIFARCAADAGVAVNWAGAGIASWGLAWGPAPSAMAGVQSRMNCRQASGSTGRDSQWPWISSQRK